MGGGGGGSDGGDPGKRKRPTKGGGVGGGPPSGDLCDNIDEFTDLLSPKAEVLAKLKRGQELLLKIRKGEPPIYAVTEKGEVAGSVVPLVLEILLKCMARGQKFVAEVVSKAGGACKVRILPQRD